MTLIVDTTVWNRWDGFATYGNQKNCHHMLKKTLVYRKDLVARCMLQVLRHPFLEFFLCYFITFLGFFCFSLHPIEHVGKESFPDTVKILWIVTSCTMGRKQVDKIYH